MNKKIILLTLVFVFLLPATIVTSSAQTRIVGVTEGNWFKYGDISGHWSSDDPNATVPSYLKDLNETEYMTISIVDVVGTNITYETTMHFQNGTEEIIGSYVDIDTGDSENVTTLVISAGLDENDTVYTSGMYSTWKLNETVTRTYPDETRDTNHINITYEQSNMEFYQVTSQNYYWDRSTGTLVEMSAEAFVQLEDFNVTLSMLMRITESNVWVVPESSTLTPILLIFIMVITAILTTAILIYKRRLLKTPIH